MPSNSENSEVGDYAIDGVKTSMAVSQTEVGLGTVRISVCGRAVEHYAAMALMKRSPKITAN